MTEKRFTFMQDTLVKADVFDGNEFVCCTLSVWVEQLVDLLNQLNDENEELKQRINNRLHYYRELYDHFDENDGFSYNIVERVVEDLEDILR